MSSKKSRKKITLQVDLPIMPGSISTARSTCGNPKCRCRKDPKYLHGTYYRWTGFLNGKRTTKTISKTVAEECGKRIKNYQKLHKKIRELLKKGLLSAPWNDNMK